MKNIKQRTKNPCDSPFWFAHPMNPDRPFQARWDVRIVLKTAGTQPVVSERLYSSVKKAQEHRWRSWVLESVMDQLERSACQLSGSTLTATTTSSMVTDSKQVKWTSGDNIVKDGGESPSVEDRTPATLASKKSWNCWTSCCHRMGHHRGPGVHRLKATCSWRREDYSASIFLITAASKFLPNNKLNSTKSCQKL